MRRPKHFVPRRGSFGRGYRTGKTSNLMELLLDPPKSRTLLAPVGGWFTAGDTRPSEEVTKMAAGADLLIHEATFGDELTERAAEDGHSTASQAAGVAVKAGVKRLILTHISSRYGDPSYLLEAALKIFPHTVIASDLLEVDVPLA